MPRPCNFRLPFCIYPITEEQSENWIYREEQSFIKFDSIEEFFAFWFRVKTLDLPLDLVVSASGAKMSWNGSSYEFSDSWDENSPSLPASIQLVDKTTNELWYVQKDGLPFVTGDPDFVAKKAKAMRWSISLPGVAFSMDLDITFYPSIWLALGENVVANEWDEIIQLPAPAIFYDPVDGSYWIRYMIRGLASFQPVDKTPIMTDVNEYVGDIAYVYTGGATPEVFTTRDPVGPGSPPFKEPVAPTDFNLIITMDGGQELIIDFFGNGVWPGSVAMTNFKYWPWADSTGPAYDEDTGHYLP